VIIWLIISPCLFFHLEQQQQLSTTLLYETASQCNLTTSKHCLDWQQPTLPSPAMQLPSLPSQSQCIPCLTKVSHPQLRTSRCVLAVRSSQSCSPPHTFPRWTPPVHERQCSSTPAVSYLHLWHHRDDQRHDLCRSWKYVHLGLHSDPRTFPIYELDLVGRTVPMPVVS
jgi:hypothetical protein